MDNIERNTNEELPQRPATDEATVASDPAPAPAPARNRRVVERARNITELCEANPNSMTKTEAVKYIKYLRELSEEYAAKINALEENARSAYRKVQYYANAAERINEIHNKQSAFIMSNLHNLITAVENTDTITRTNIDSIIKGGLSE